MYTTSALWKAYQALSHKKYELKVVFNDNEAGAYYDDDIFSMSSELQLCDDEVFNIGNLYARKLSLSICPKETAIPTMSSVKPYVRMNGLSGPTEWIPQGKFNVDTRKSSDGLKSFECLDKAVMMETPFVVEGESLTFPMLHIDALTVICTRLGISLVNPSDIQGFYIEYTNALTMREVAEYIAGANGGNFILNNDGNLKLILPVVGASVAVAEGDDFEENNESLAYNKVVVYYDETNAYSAGTGDSVYTLTNPWATQAMANYVLSKLSTYTHKAFTCSGAEVDPTIELGDTITVEGTSQVVFVQRITYGSAIAIDLESPGETQLFHEYPYVGSYKKAIQSKVTLGASYYGVTIDRAYGLKIARTDGASEAIFNSDQFVMRALSELGVMVDKIYFDPVSGEYKFSGTVEIVGGTLNIGGNCIVDENGVMRLSGGATIYGAKFYAGTPGSPEGYTEMSLGGLKVYNAEGLLKIWLGYTSGEEDHPFIRLGAGDGGSASYGLFKKFTNGLWIGNSEPFDEDGAFVAQAGYNGIFFNTSENKAYIVNGASMSSLYTGLAIAKFGG